MSVATEPRTGREEPAPVERARRTNEGVARLGHVTTRASLRPFAEGPRSGAPAVERVMEQVRNLIRRLLGRSGRQASPANVVSRTLMLAELDRRAQRYLDMTGSEFLAALDAGSLQETPTVVQLSVLAGRR